MPSAKSWLTAKEELGLGRREMYLWMATREGDMKMPKASSVDPLSCELTWSRSKECPDSLRVCHARDRVPHSSAVQCFFSLAWQPKGGSHGQVLITGTG